MFGAQKKGQLFSKSCSVRYGNKDESLELFDFYKQLPARELCSIVRVFAHSAIQLREVFGQVLHLPMRARHCLTQPCHYFTYQRIEQ